jgi:hypothetical protein
MTITSGILPPSLANVKAFFVQSTKKGAVSMALPADVQICCASIGKRVADAVPETSYR